ncbi:MAG: diguanylate cyclase [Planctomycetota bacterium]
MSSPPIVKLDLNQVPSPPAVAARLLETIDNHKADTAQIIQIVSSDPALSAKLIAFCNSPSQRRKHEITNLKQAVMRVGSKRLKLLALSFSLLKSDTNDDLAFDMDQFWMKSLANALTCSVLGKQIGRQNEEDFLLGLVMNLGQVALALSCPDQYTAEYQRLIDLDDHRILDQERSEFGNNRFSITAQLLRQWRFPETMCQEVACLGNLSGEDSCESLEFLLYASELASTLYLDDDTFVNERREALMYRAESMFGLEEFRFAEVLEELIMQWNEYKSLFGINAETPKVSDLYGDFDAMESEAKSRMLEMSLDAVDELRDVKSNNSELTREANIDPLTALKNRRSYDRDASKAIELATANETPFGILILDIDYFKIINDSYGHAVGDEVLKKVGQMIRNCLREDDSAYRIGGEEFVLLLANCTFRQSVAVSERIRSTIETTPIELEDGEFIYITVSVGVSWSKDAGDRKLEEYFEKADKLLYEAKNSGRNQCKVEQAGA